MSNCGCNDVNTTPCTSTTGCTSTHYSKCIVYSGTTLSDCVSITNGDNLDTVISAMATAICALTPADLAWNTFDYGCLGPYSTAQAFAEGVSAAHCALVTRVEDLETPTFTRCSLFTSGPYTITPGTTTLQEILEFYATILCDLSDNSPATITVPNYCFSSNAGIVTLEDWFIWVVENVCNIRTALLASITTNTNNISALQTYLGSAGALASKHDMSCLSGGATETAYDSIELIRDEVCALNTTVGALPDFNNITLSWASCYAYSATASLSTQLGRIVSVLKAQKYTFSSDFTVVSGACENTVSLAASVGAFACSDLEGCSIHNLGDVHDDALTNSELGYRLTWYYDSILGTSIWKAIRNSDFTNVGIQAKAGVYSGEPNGFYFKNQATPTNGDPKDYHIGFVEDAWLDLTAYLDADYTAGLAPNYTPKVKKTWDGHIYFKGAVESAGTPAVGAPAQPMSNNAYSTVATGIPAVYRPSADQYVDILVRYPHNANNNLDAFVGGQLIFTSTGDLKIKCYDVTVAADIGVNYDGDHSVQLTGRSIYL